MKKKNFIFKGSRLLEIYTMTRIINLLIYEHQKKKKNRLLSRLFQFICVV